MDRYSYLNELNLLLLELPKKEREAALAYFEDYFKNHKNIEDEEIIQTIGSPLENANRIKQKFTSNGGELHQESAVQQNSDSNMERSSYSWLWLVLSILTFPIWLPIGIVLLVMSIVMLILLSVVLLVIGITTIALLAGGIICIVSGIIKCFTIPAIGIAVTGIGLVTVGISILLVNLCGVIFGKGLPALFKGISSLFKRKKKKKW